MQKIMGIMCIIMLLAGCGAHAGAGTQREADSAGETAATSGNESGQPALWGFDADSAYSYVARQVEFGPRVPNSAAHARTGDWLAGELKRHGAEVTEQRAPLTAFDGTALQMRNIMGSFNPAASDRLLLLAHYDTRPWADQDEDASNHGKAIDGANDGASGVGVLLEVARRLGAAKTSRGIDILFVDCEDYGAEGDDDSWALGAKYFATHPIKPGYRPSRAILLDMVGGRGARFPAEYFSRQAAADLDDAVRLAAGQAGHADMFPRVFGSAVTDDHVPLIQAGIPAVDIIDYRIGEGFCPTWHTMADNMQNIDPETLRSVGETLMQFLQNEK